MAIERARICVFYAASMPVYDDGIVSQLSVAVIWPGNNMPTGTWKLAASSERAFS